MTNLQKADYVCSYDASFFPVCLYMKWKSFRINSKYLVKRIWHYKPQLTWMFLIWANCLCSRLFFSVHRVSSCSTFKIHLTIDLKTPLEFYIHANPFLFRLILFSLRLKQQLWVSCFYPRGRGRWNSLSTPLNAVTEPLFVSSGNVGCWHDRFSLCLRQSREVRTCIKQHVTSPASLCAALHSFTHSVWQSVAQQLVWIQHLSCWISLRDCWW